jgi:sodium transport system permease protein
MGATWTVMRKELRDFTRDRRTFWLTLLMAPLLYPLLMIGIGALTELRKDTQLDKVLEVPVLGAEHAPTLVAWLGSHAIKAKPAPADLEAEIRSQREDIGIVIPADFARDWRAGKPAKVELVMDTTRRDAEVPSARISAALQSYSQSVGGLRLLARGINPAVAQPVNVATRDLATPEAKRGLILSFVLPLILLLLAFIGGSHLAMDTTAGERERQSLEPLLATPAARGSIVSGKMLAAGLIGIAALLLTLLSFKLSANLASGAMRSMDVSFPAIAKMLVILLPLVLIGTALLTFIAAGAKSMKEAQGQLVPLMLLPMLPGYALMAYPLKDTALWQYAVPFLSQNQLLVKVSRGESPSAEQWAIYLAASLALAALLWLAAVWRYRQEKLAISA